MKNRLHLKFIILLHLLVYANVLQAQCTGCDQSYSSGSPAITLTANQTLCITGSVTPSSITFNTSNTICISSNGTLNLSTLNANNINVTINVNTGGVFNYSGTDFSSTATFTLNNSGTVNLTNTGQFTLVGNGGQTKTINNLTGGVFNAIAPSLFYLNSINETFNNQGTANFTNVENTDGQIINGSTSNATAKIKISGYLYNHGDFQNYGSITGTGTGTTTTFNVGNKGAGLGMKNYSTATINWIGNTTISGYFTNDGTLQVTGNLTINGNSTTTLNTPSGTGKVRVLNGTSNISNSCFGGTNMTFCDVNTAGNVFDVNTAPSCTSGINYSVSCSFAVLNIILIGFDYITAGNETKLRWTVNTDETQSKYEVQQSSDAINFTTIQTILDNRTGLVTYVSNAITTQTGKNYYRIKLIKLSGAFDYTNTKLISILPDNIKLFPNPTINNVFTITVPDTKITFIHVFTIEGKEILNNKLTGLTNYTITLPGNIKGDIIVEILYQNETKRFKILAL